jgi:hypothetical protein
LAAVAGVVVAYNVGGHSVGPQGQQAFSVPLNSGRESEGASTTGRHKASTLDFTVKHCDIESKQVSCSMTVVSPGYDRRFLIDYETHLIDSDGDSFRMTSVVSNK